MTYEVYLAHHGIKGQKWGVRRYQNEDGSLTAAGKMHYGVDSKGNLSEKGKKKFGQDLVRQKRKENTKMMEEDLGRKRLLASQIIAGIPGQMAYRAIRLSQIKKQVERGEREIPEWMREISVEELLKKHGVR